MTYLNNTVVFNRFPAHKEFLCNLLEMAFAADREINSAFNLQPQMYNRIYFTMTENELKSVAKRRGNPEIANEFPKCDAIYSYSGQCIILHIPAMACKLSEIPLLLLNLRKLLKNMKKNY